MRTLSLLRALPVAAVLFLAACGDGSLRSPDLPPERLTGIGNVGCTPPSIAVGQSSVCRITGQCTYVRVTAEGLEVSELRQCPADVTFTSSNPNAGPIDQNGVVTGQNPGTTLITASSGGKTSAETPVVINGACAQSLAISPLNQTLVAGLGLNYTATVTFSNGSTQNVSTSAGTTFTSSNPAVASVAANRVTAASTVAAPTTVTIGVTTTAVSACPNTTLSASTSLTVRPAQILTTNGLCIETVPPATDFQGCRADSGSCQTPTTAIAFQLANPPQTRQLQIRARYDDGTECDVTSQAALTTNPTGIVSINNSTGVASGVGGGSTTISAAFNSQTATRPATVTVNQVLGNNSLAVFSQKKRSADPVSYDNSLKFACVGANDLVINGLGNRTKRGSLPLNAFSKTCLANQLDANGNCAVVPAEGGDPSAAAFDLVELTDNVTNLAGVPAGSLNDRIAWKSVPGYWNGREQGCVQSGSVDDTPAPVGDLFIDPRALQFGPADGEPNPDGFPINDPTQQPNGLVYSDAAIRLGFSCVTATYTNPQNPADTVTDGMTVLVLPIVNDVLLGGSSDGDALCETLEPLFSNPLLGLLELTPVLNGITSNLNPTVLQTLDVVPLDQITTQVVNGLSPVTAPLINALDQFLVDPVLEPVVCQITGVVNTLLGALTGGGGNQECTTAPPAP